MLQKDAREYFIRIAEYCRRCDIRLVVVTTPVPAQTLAANLASYTAAAEEMKSLSNAYDFSYLNYTEGELLLANQEFTNADLFADWDGHMYADTARRFSAVLAADIAAADK